MSKARKTTKSRSKSAPNDKMISKLNELTKLNDRKVELLKSLVTIEERYNSLVSDIKTPEEWLYGLPIESLQGLDVDGKRRTRLGDVRVRADLKKSSLKALKELEKIDREIKDAQIDLLRSKIDITLGIDAKSK